MYRLFTIQPTSLLDHHPVSPFLDTPVTSHLMFSNRAISITAQRLWNELRPELRTISSPPPPSLQTTRHHLHPPPLSVTPRAFHSTLKSHLFKHSYPDPSDHSLPISTIPTLTATLSPPGTMEIEPELLLTPLENP